METKINVLERFAKWLVNEGKAAATIDSYINDVKQFNRYLVEKDVDPEVLLTRFLFKNYKKQIETEGMAMSTIDKKVNSLKE